jgi:hypothetical protein
MGTRRSDSRTQANRDGNLHLSEVLRFRSQGQGRAGSFLLWSVQKAAWCLSLETQPLLLVELQQCPPLGAAGSWQEGDS